MTANYPINKIPSVHRSENTQPSENCLVTAGNGILLGPGEEMSSDSASEVSCSFSSAPPSAYNDNCVRKERYTSRERQCSDDRWKRWSCEGLTKLCSPASNTMLKPLTNNVQCDYDEDNSSDDSWDYMALRNVMTENNFVLSKGDRLVVLQLSKDKKWAEVKKRDNSTGWIQFNNIKSIEDYKSSQWYHANTTRVEAEDILRSGVNGSFLVRDSESIKGQLSLSLRCEERIYHYRINRDERNRYYVNGEKRFSTLNELISNHTSKADGLICPLKNSIKSEATNGRNLKPPYVRKQDILFNESAKKRGVSGHKPYEIRRKDLILKQKLGGGQYGDVYEAFWKERHMKVAVKTLRAEGHMGIDDFLSEAALMQMMEHPNLVKLYGVCSNDAPYFIVSEYMSKGNLTDHLKQEKPALPILIQMMVQISSAMAYLERHHFIHRDLAARNCLVGEDHVVKVADFGLARILREDHYNAKSGSKFPIKWTAPEGLAYSRFSNKSDVWSFGVLIWEIVSYGGVPFVGVNLSDVYQLLSRGYRMTVPVTCPKTVSKLMKRCWEWYPEDRPSFEELMKEFDKMLELYTSKCTRDSNDAKGLRPTSKTKHKDRYNQSDDVIVVDKDSIITGNCHNEESRFPHSGISPRKLKTLIRSGSCQPPNNRIVRNDSVRASRRVLKPNNNKEDFETLIRTKTGQFTAKSMENKIPIDNANYVRRSDDISAASSTTTSEDIVNKEKVDLSRAISKLDIRSADESGYYEEDIKFSNNSLHEMIKNLEHLRKKIADSQLVPLERKNLMYIIEENLLNIHSYLDNIESAPLRLRLRESLDVLQALVPKILASQQSANDHQKISREVIPKRTERTLYNGKMANLISMFSAEGQGNSPQEAKVENSCLNWMISKDSANDVEQMDRILQFLIKICSNSSTNQKEERLA